MKLLVMLIGALVMMSSSSWANNDFKVGDTVCGISHDGRDLEGEVVGPRRMVYDEDEQPVGYYYTLKWDGNSQIVGWPEGSVKSCD